MELFPKVRIEQTDDVLRIILRAYFGETVLLIMLLVGLVGGTLYGLEKMSPMGLKGWLIGIVPLAFGFFAIGMRENTSIEFDRREAQLRWRRFYKYRRASGVAAFHEIRAIRRWQQLKPGADGLPPIMVHGAELLTHDNKSIQLIASGLTEDETTTIIAHLKAFLPNAAVIAAGHTK